MRKKIRKSPVIALARTAHLPLSRKENPGFCGAKEKKFVDNGNSYGQSLCTQDTWKNLIP